MLHCVYHPIDEMRVVDGDERENLISTGFWFDSPNEARAYREKVENKVKVPEKKGNTKKEGKNDEKSSNV